MPFCAVFWACAYLMYKYQLLYVYINDYQSGGDMWYATFGRSLISLIFASVTLLGYLSLEVPSPSIAGRTKN
jgi:lysine-specific demethylase 3